MALTLASNIPRLTEEEKVEVEKHLRLAYSLAAKYAAKRSIELDEAKQMAALGLMRAIQKYEPDKGFALSTYAKWWIDSTIGRYHISTYLPYMRPAHVDQAMSFIRKKKESYESEHGKNADEEIQIEWLRNEFTRTEMSVDTAKALIIPTVVLSLNAKIFQDTDRSDTYADSIIDPEEISIEDKYISDEMVSVLERALDTLSERERDILIKRNGLRDTEEMTLQQIGDFYGVSRERVRQIEARAKRKVRKYISNLNKRETRA